jgi:ABC-type amino acid transport substrate-binding protein
MFDIITKTINQMGALWEYRGPFIEFCRDHPFWAGVFIFILFVGVGYIVVTNFVEFIRKFAQWMQSTRGRVGVSIAFCAVSLLSLGAVMWINALSAPAPSFLGEDVATFVVGEPVRLRWSYAGVADNEPILYEVQSAGDPAFEVGVKHEGYAESGYKPIKRPINGVRYWRVRTVDPSDRQRPSSRWGRGIRIEQYESAFRRIAATGTFSVYVSNSVEQGVFKFRSDDDGKPDGYDIMLTQILAERLPAKMGIGGPLKLRLVPVSWEDMLDSPSEGKADMIISTITKFSQREEVRRIKFSMPYYSTTQSLVYRCGDADRPLRERLRGKRIGVQKATTSELLINALRDEMGGEALSIQNFPQLDDIIAALLRTNSNIDYVLTDTPFAVGAELQNRPGGSSRLGYKTLTPEDFPGSIPPEQRVENYAVAVRAPDVELLAAINSIIAEMKDSGELDRLFHAATTGYERAINAPTGSAGCAASGREAQAR